MLQKLRLRGAIGRSVVSSFVGTAGMRIVGVGLGFVVGVQLARSLGPDGYGVYGFVMSIIALLLVPTQFGLPQLAMRELAAASAMEEGWIAREFLRWSTRIALAMSLLVAAATLVVISWTRFEAPAFSSSLIWGVALIPFVSFLNIWGGALRGLSYVNLGQFPEVIMRPGLFSLALAIIAIYAPNLATPVGAMALQVAVAAISAMVAWYWLIRRLPKQELRSSGTLLIHTRWRTAAIPMALTEGSRVIQGHAAILLLGFLGTATMVGLFKVSVAVAIAVSTPITLAHVAAAPHMARLFAASDRQRLGRLCTACAQMMTVGVIILGSPFLLAGDSLLAYVFGEEFRHAHWPLLILFLGHVVSGLMGPAAILLNMANQERRVTRVFFYALLINLGLAFVLIPPLGAFGAAVASTTGIIVLHIIWWADARRLLTIDTSVLPWRTGK